MFFGERIPRGKGKGIKRPDYSHRYGPRMRLDGGPIDGQALAPPNLYTPPEPNEATGSNPHVKLYRVYGLDLGQASDYSALAGLERKAYGPGYSDWCAGELAKIPQVDALARANKVKELTRDSGCRLCYLRQWPKKTPYPQIVEDVVEVTKDIDVLVIDFGGPGRPVVDMLYRATRAGELGADLPVPVVRSNTDTPVLPSTDYKARIRPVNIVGSSAAMQMHRESRGNYWSVPKVDIVTSLAVMIQQERLKSPPTYRAEVAALVKEMRNFQMKRTTKGNVQFESRTGTHDDLVLALGLACWWMLRFGVRSLNML